jgi:hypothetical protein
VIINSIFTTETDVIGADIVSDQNVISIENNVEELSTSDVSDLITRMGLKISA